MADFFRAQNGRFRSIRFAACLYVLSGILNLVNGGSPASCIPWLLVALAFIAYSVFAEGAKSRGARWDSWNYQVGNVATVIGLGVLAYRTMVHR